MSHHFKPIVLLLIAVMLLQLCVSLTVGWTQSRPQPPELHTRLSEILAKPEYQQDVPQWWDRISQPLRRIVSKILQFLFGNPFWENLRGTSPILYWILVIVLIAAVVALTAHILWMIASAFRPKPKRRQPREQLPSARLSPDALRQAARRAAAEGDYAQALRYLYESLISYLDRQGILVYDRAATNWDYLRQLRDDSDLADLLRPLNNVVDGAWYGKRPVDAGEFADCEQLVDEAWRLGGGR